MDDVKQSTDELLAEIKKLRTELEHAKTLMQSAATRLGESRREIADQLKEIQGLKLVIHRRDQQLQAIRAVHNAEVAKRKKRK